INEKTERIDVNGKPIYAQKSLEVDFVATKGNQKIYLQSALAMESDDGTTVTEPLEQNTQNSEEGEGENQEPATHEEETAGSSIKDDYDYEVDYLSTISDLISNLMN
ncbi:MAG: hypothetical protein J6Y86_06960, partial [Pseudobutyrivibrio sp.]|nr:hypothetical protein [Pseudobutyrivibrio sp.]